MVANAEWDDFALRCSFAGVKAPEKPASLRGKAQQRMSDEQVAQRLASLKARLAELGMAGKPLEADELAKRLAEHGSKVDMLDPLKESRKGWAHG